MSSPLIEESEIKDLLVSSLPTRPTAPSAFGGKGYTVSEMKEAFDKLPLFIIEKFNSLINDAYDGILANYLYIDEYNLYDTICTIKEQIAAIMEHLGIYSEEE